MKVAANGGQPEELLHFEARVYDPSVSPDGRSLAYLQYSVVSAKKTLKAVVADLETGKTMHEYVVPQGADQLEWTPDGTALTYLSSTGQSQSLFLQPLSGTPVTRILHFDSEPMLIMAYDWSHDGKKLAVTRAPYHSTDVVMFSIPPK